MKIATCLAMVTACAACSSAPEFTKVIPLPSKDPFTFPDQVYVESLVARGCLYTNHRQMLRADLIADHGVIPVELFLGLREAKDAGQARISPEDMRLRLYLPDGTVLSAIPPEQIPGASPTLVENLRSRALKHDLLLPFDKSKAGLVFFQLENARDAYAWQSSLVAQHQRFGIARTIDLSKSLCSFEVTVGLRQVPVYVGLRQDTYRESLP